MNGPDRLSDVLPMDGRGLDPRLADATGGGARQRGDAQAPDRPMPGAGAPVWDQLDPPSDTYYDQPVVKAPPWGGLVAAYLVLGGASGSAAVLAAAADVAGGRQLAGLARVARLLALTAGGVGGVALTADLGRPGRALHMLRVFKPTSPMNVGGYVLGATLGGSTTALLGRGPLARASGVVGGAAGTVLCGYTGVLLGATAIPGWNVGLRTLPALFAASGVATSASALRLAPVGPGGHAAVGALAVAAQAAELACEVAHDRALAGRPHTKAAYETTTGWRLGRILTCASLALGMLPARHIRARRIAAALGVGGSVATKVAVFEAGMRSAADPRAVPESR